VAADRGIAPPPSVDDIGLVEVTQSPRHAGVVTAVKDHDGHLKVQDFGASVVGTDLVVDARDSDVSATPVHSLDIATLFTRRGVTEPVTTAPFRGVVTVERRGDNSAWVQSWSIDASGSSVVRDSSIQVKRAADDAAVAVQDVEITVAGDSATRELAVVSVRRTDNTLVLYTYQVKSDGTPARLDEWVVGSVTAISNAGTWSPASGPRG